MARPTKLTKALCEDVTFYIKECKADKLLPTIEGLAVHLEINKTTIYEWKKSFVGDNSQITPEEHEENVKLHEEFSNLIDNMLNIQANELINKGLKSEYNSTIAKVLLTKHGYREGIDTDMTSKGEKMSIGTATVVLDKANEILKGDKLNANPS